MLIPPPRTVGSMDAAVKRTRMYSQRVLGGGISIIQVPVQKVANITIIMS